MKTTAQLLDLIENALRNVHYPAHPAGLYEPIAYVLEEGGKRIRPLLVLMGYGLYRDDVEKALPAALALETYHNHTLLHDDLMDNADMRRNRPTVHCKWNANTAILSGDTMLLMAFRHLLKAPCSQPEALFDLFSRSAVEICEGQQYDVNFETRTDVTEAEYIEMIRLKTSVLLACSIKTGALLAEAPAADAEALYRFAEKVGLAFQLQDDYLDVYGDPAVFGKKIGGDILCGKKTFLLIRALGKANAARREELLRLLNSPTLPDEEKISAVRKIYDDLSVAEDCQTAINGFYEEARRALDEVALPETCKMPLWDFATSLLKRKK